MDSCNCNSHDKNNDMTFSTDTFSTVLKTERQIEGLIAKTETVADTVNTFVKQESFKDESLNIKQETFVDESLNIERETKIKTEEIFDENEISPEEVSSSSYSNNYHLVLQKVMDDDTSHEYSNSHDIKRERGNMIDSNDSFDTDDSYKNRNLESLNSRPSGLKYEDGELIDESSIINRQKRTYESVKENFGTVLLLKNDFQGKKIV